MAKRYYKKGKGKRKVGRRNKKGQTWVKLHGGGYGWRW